MNDKFKSGLVPLFLVTLFLFVAVLAGFSGFSLPSGGPDITGQVITSQQPAAPTIRPGSGWSGLTPTPAARGNGPTPIARWDVVPYQTITGKFGIGIPAFHINGIERVDFAVNGGNWVSVNQMTKNPYSGGVVEYWVEIDANDFPVDGPVEIRATVIPSSGTPIVFQGNDLTEETTHGVHSMFINTNSRGTLPSHTRYVDPVRGNDSTGDGTENNPFKSIVAAAADITTDSGSSDGGIVYLKAGEYFWGTEGTTPRIITNNRWLTIKPAPGLTKNQVKITDTSSGGLKTKFVKIEDVHVHNTIVGSAGATNVWADNVLFTGNDLSSFEFPLRNSDWNLIYGTNNKYSMMRRAIGGYTLGRNLTVDHIGGDMFKTPYALINVTGSNLIDANPNLGAAEGDIHRDVVQIQSPPKRWLIYGLTATKNISGQDFFATCGAGREGCNFKDVAFVNYMVNSKSLVAGKWNIAGDHLLLWNMFHGSTLSFPSHEEGRPKILTNLSIRNSVFGALSGFNPVYWNINNGGNFAIDNHYISGRNVYGINYTTGGSLAEIFTKYTTFDAPDNDFHPKPGSVLVNANRPLAAARQVLADREWTPVPAGPTMAIGPLQARGTAPLPEPEPNPITEPDPTDPIIPDPGEEYDPAPPPEVIEIGSQVITQEGIRVRAAPSTNATIVGNQGRASIGIVTDGPTSANGERWWKVDFQNEIDGWGPETSLVVYDPPSSSQGPTSPVTSLPTNLPYMGGGQPTGRVFYVDPRTGSMNNNGSEARPWSTIQEVIAAKKIQSKDKNGATVNPNGPVKSGDTIYLRNGNHGGIRLGRYFNDNYITIAAEPGHIPVVDYISLTGGKNWEFRGLKVLGNPRNPAPKKHLVTVRGYTSTGPASNVKIIGNDIRSVEDASTLTLQDWLNRPAGIQVWRSPGIEIRKNLIESIDVGIGGISDGAIVSENWVNAFAHDGLRGGGSNILIENNRITNSINNGNSFHRDLIQFFGVGGGRGPGCFCNNVIFRNNFLANNTGPFNRAFQGRLQGVGLFNGPYANWTIENNVILGVGSNGISSERSSGFKVINNTLIGRQYGSSVIVPGQMNKTGIRLDNNSSNIVSNNIGSISQTLVNKYPGMKNISVSTEAAADRYFANWRAQDLRLKSGSPAINAGLATYAPPRDITGSSRDSRPDVGAYEYPGGENLPVPTEPPPTQEPTPPTTPNPTVPPTTTVPPTGQISLGSTVEITEKIRVRAEPNGARIGIQNKGALGVIAEGPKTVGEFNWWRVDYKEGVDGWSADKFFILKSSPSGPGTPTTPPTTPTTPPTTGVTNPTPPGGTVSTEPVGPAIPITSPTLGTTPTVTAPSAGLSMHFKFDGSIADSIKGVLGISEGALSYTDGKIGQAVILNGSNNAITLGNKTLNDLGIGNQFTISAWILSDDASKNRASVFTKGAIGAGADNASIDLIIASGDARLRVSNGTTVVTAPSNSSNRIISNTWYLVTGTFNGNTGTAKLYQNGVKIKESTEASVAMPNDSSSVLATGIGVSAGNDKAYFKGKIDDLRIYNRVLSDSEIKGLYDGSVLGAEDRRGSYFAAVAKGINNFFAWFVGLFEN